MTVVLFIVIVLDLLHDLNFRCLIFNNAQQFYLRVGNTEITRVQRKMLEMTGNVSIRHEKWPKM